MKDTLERLNWMCLCGHAMGRHAGRVDGKRPCCGSGSSVTHSDCVCVEFALAIDLPDLVALERELWELSW